MHLTALKLQLRKSVKHIRKSYVSWRIKNCKIITATWILGYFAILSLCAPQSREFHTSNVPWSSKIKAHLKNGSMDVWKLPQNQMWITITPKSKSTYGWSWGWCWQRPLHTCSWLSLCKVQRQSRRHHWVPKSQSTGSSRPRSRWSASCCPPQSSRPPGTTPPPVSDWKLKLWISSITWRYTVSV